MQQCGGCPLTEFGPPISSTCSPIYFTFLSILQSFINTQCDLVDPCNRVQERVIGDSYDFVVIGGGASGAVAAARLSEVEDWKVLLIEAGSDEPSAGSIPAFMYSYYSSNKTDWLYSTIPDDKACRKSDGVCYWPRAKMLGGCTSANGMIYARARKADFADWVKKGATGWSWEDVKPHFYKNEDIKKKGRRGKKPRGPIPIQNFNHAPDLARDIVNASHEIGFPVVDSLNDEGTGGFTLAEAMYKDGIRYSTAKAFLRPASKRKNLDVLLNAQVTKVIIDPKSKRVTGVEYQKDGQRKTVRVKKEAILSAGTLNTPQLMMLSGIGPANTLKRFRIPPIKDLPGVGQQLHNHFGASLKFTIKKMPTSNILTWASAMQYMLTRQGPLSGSGLAQLTGMANSRYTDPKSRRPDIQFFFNGLYAACSDGSITEKNNTEPERLRVSVIGLHPESTGYVTLQSPNPLSKPLFKANYFNTTHDYNVIIDGVRILYKLFNASIIRDRYEIVREAGFGSDCPGDPDQLSDEHIKCLASNYTAPENHQVGTAKIGSKDDPMAVVDPQLKVYGIQGLRVADASVYPTPVSANTAATTIMIGERCADFIKREYKKG